MGYSVIYPWPGNSTDLNIIENCCAFVKRKISELQPTSLSELKQKIEKVWTHEITDKYIARPYQIQF